VFDAAYEAARRADPTPEVRRRIEGEFADRVIRSYGETSSDGVKHAFKWMKKVAEESK
jgi:hypothetical protein